LRNVKHLAVGWVIVVAVGAGAVGATIGRLIPPFVPDDTWGWKFVVSPGLGGLAAVLAAIIGSTTAIILGARERRARVRKDRKEQWWERAKWALDLTVDAETTKRSVGYRVLESLASSEWADEHESDIIDAATEDATESHFEQSVPVMELADALESSTQDDS
jgi:hypothetical protein